MFVSSYPTIWHMISICLIIGDAYFEHIVKVVSVRLHCRVSLFSFVINKYFVGKYFDTM